jgi:hypothetical protein
MPMIRKMLAVLLLLCAAAYADPQPRVSPEAVPALKAMKTAIDAKDWRTAIETGEAAHSADYSDFDWYLLQRFLLVSYFHVDNRIGAAIAAYNCVMSPAIPAPDLKALLGVALTLANEQNDTAHVLEIARVHAQMITDDERASAIVAAALYNADNKVEARRYAKRSAELARQAGHEPETGVQQMLERTEGF